MSAGSFLAQLPAHWPDAAATIVFAGVSAHWGSRMLARFQATSSSGALVASRPPWWLVLGLIAFFAFPLLPFEGRRLSFAAVGAGMLGEFSTMTFLLVITSYLPKPCSAISKRFMLALTVLGLALYTSVLTYTSLDLYRLGYAHAGLSPWEHWILPGLVSVGALALPLRMAVLLCLASLAWMLGIQSSNNYWDHLLDVPLFIYAFGMSLKWSWKRLADS